MRTGRHQTPSRIAVPTHACIKSYVAQLLFTATPSRQRRCRQQLRPRPLHRREGNRGSGPGQDPTRGRQLHWTARLLRLPQLWRRNRFRVYVLADGALDLRLRQEAQDGVLHLSRTAGEVDGADRRVACDGTALRC